MKPIIMSTEDVRGILDGRKTMVRMPMKPQPVRNGAFWELGGAGWSMDTVTPVYGHSLYNRMPHKPGDVLWVRETWKPQDYQFIDGMWNCAIVYKAGGMEGRVYWPDGTDSIYERCGIWRPSIHMPREAARLFLRVTDVQVEQVQDINEEDADAEGVGGVDNFIKLWDTINTKSGLYKWKNNPFVWTICFERVGKDGKVREIESP
jgi:hypothetical protein